MHGAIGVNAARENEMQLWPTLAYDKVLRTPVLASMDSSSSLEGGRGM